MKKSFASLFTLAIAGLMLVGCGETSSTTSAKASSSSAKTQESSAKTSSAAASSAAASSNQGGQTGDVSDQNVKTIAVKTNPTKMTYVIGETFDPAGGVLTVTYTDSKTADLSMTDSRVTISALNTAVAGTKTVKITFGGKSCSLKNIQVTNELFDITFNTNGGSAVATLSAEKGKAATAPADPTKDGFDFDGWFIDEACTLAYDWSETVSCAFTLYAHWLTHGAVIRNVTFDYGYYGALPATRVLKVDDGTPVTKISQDPTRLGYDFGGWQKDGVTDYDFTANVTADITLKANWVRSTTELVGVQTYKFEAEDIDFTGITGAGLSGTTTEAGSIVTKAGFGASQDMYVSYMYKFGNTLKFEIISDVAVDNITFKASLSQEIENYSYNKDNYQISVNSVPLDYGTISFNDVPARVGDTTDPQQFAEYTIGTISLKAGNNEISFMTNNEVGISGTTMVAHAPLLDYISLTGDNFVANWDNVKGYPKANYTKK